MIVLAYLLRGAGVLLRWLAMPFILIGWATAWISAPLVWLSRWCIDRALEWDPRLWERGEHTDLNPPDRSQRDA